MLNQNLLLGDDGYNIQRSLRLRSSASAYLSKSYIFGTSANDTSLVKKTYSFWMKRGTLGTDQMILSNYTSAGNLWQIAFDTSDRLYIFQQLASTITLNKATTQVFRDPSSWYHIVIVVDTTLATAEDRFQIWVNNTRVTSWSTNTIAAQNANALSYFTYTSGTWTGNIGRRADALYYFDGYLTEFNAIDGQALTPSSFGETDAVTGVWKAKKYGGTYGTNGFYLNFSDNSSNTATTIGKDYSGNGNNWTPNNISVTAGATYDSMTDVPTLTSATQANYCVLNAASIGADATLSNGNLDIAYGSNNTRNATMGTFGVSSGKWYWEVTITASNLTPTGAIIGITENSSASAVSNYPGNNANDWGYYGNTGNKYTGGTGFAYGATYTTNDVIGVALDMDAGTLTFYKNNVSQGQATSGLTGTKFPAIGDGGGVNTFSASLNFGQRPFAYTPPTGFKALNTINLPEPSIKVGNKHFDATTYSGTTGVLPVTNTSGFKPDLVWIKVRSTTGSNVLQDSVRGTTAYLQSNATSAENTNTSLDWFRSFNSNGFTVSSTTTGGTPTSEWNTSGNTYVAWQWKAGGSAVSNTAGTITSQVSANPSAGFSIVAYTGNGTGGATIGHGLGVAPAIIIIKQRSTASVNGNWAVYHKSLGNTGYLGLNLTSAVANDIGYWNNTSPTSSVFSVGTFEVTNRSTATYVAYCFSEVAGYSKTFSYTGNGSTDGVFIYLGFKPRFVMVKRTDSLGSWHIVDAARSSYNQMGLGLFPDLSSAEAADFNSDALSNGLKIRNSQGEINASGGTYIGIAFSENPFKYSLAQ